MSSEINSFFNRIYQAVPVQAQEGKSTKYAVAGREIAVITDPYGGCHIEMATIPGENLSAIREAIQELCNSFAASNAYDSVWLDLPYAPMSKLGSIAPDSFVVGAHGKSDLIYDYPQRKIHVWQWLNPKKECTIPPGATHNIGATAALIDSTAKTVLLVENQRRQGSWNLPGGSFDITKDTSPAVTALRELEEETGLRIENRDLNPILMGQMQFPKNQFAPAINQIWAFFIAGISAQALTPPADEIKQAKWFKIEDVVNSKGTLESLKVGAEIMETLSSINDGIGCEKVADKGWMVVHIAKKTKI